MIIVFYADYQSHWKLQKFSWDFFHEKERCQFWETTTEIKILYKGPGIKFDIKVNNILLKNLRLWMTWAAMLYHHKQSWYTEKISYQCQYKDFIQ